MRGCLIMANFKNGDLVIITEGEYKGIPGKVVDNDGPVMWVMLSTTKQVANVHEEHMEQLNLAMKEESYKEFESLFEALDVDVKKI